MFTFVDAVLERAAARGARGVEVYAESAASRRVKVYRREVEQLTAAQRRGLGVRVFRDGAVGYAYTSDLADAGLDDVVRRAIDHGYARAADLADVWNGRAGA
jgi:PmbA protein